MKRTLASIIAILICSGAALPCYAQTESTDDIPAVSLEQTEETTDTAEETTDTAEETADSAEETADSAEEETSEVLTSENTETDEIMSGPCGANLTWEYDGNITLTISGSGDMYSYTSDTIPWKSDLQSIRTIVVNEGVTSIGDNAFNGLYNVSSLTLPSTLTKIGDSALKGVGVGTGTTSPLTALSIPQNVSSIADNAFSGMSKLESVTVDTANSSFCSEDGVLYNKSKSKLILLPAMKSGTYTVPSAVSSIGDYAFEGGNLSAIAVESGNSNYVVEDGVLYNSSKSALLKYPAAKSIVSFSVPSGVTEIKPYAFADSDVLQVLVLPDSVTSIGEYAFFSCSNLEKVNIPSRVTEIKPYTFSGCSNDCNPNKNNITTNVYMKIPGSVKKIDERAFYQCGITALIIEEGVESIGKEAFSNNTVLTSVVIPSSVTEVGYYAFNTCTRLANLETKALSSAYYSDKAFPSCLKLKHIHIPDDQEIISYTSNQSFHSSVNALKTASNYVKTSSCSSSTCGLITEFPEETPEIITQPTAASVDAGNTAYFTVAVKGDVSSYQWQYSTDGGSTWVNSAASSAAASTLTIANADMSLNNNLYRCSISFTNGTTLVTDSAMLTVIGGYITSQPQAVSINAGETASFSVTASGSVVSYQWQFSKDGGTTWVNSGVDSATTADLTITNAYAGLDNYLYRCKVTFDGDAVLYSDSALLNVKGGSITSQPSVTSVYVGQTASFSIRATGAIVSYQWQFSSDGGSTWNNSGASGAKTNTLTISNVNSGLNRYYYRCLVTYQGGQCEYSNSVMLTVLAAPITSQPSAVTVYAGQTATFSVAASVDVASYQWQYLADGGTAWCNSGATGAKTSTLTIANTNTGLNGYSYRCVITAADGTKIYSDSAVLTVNSSSLITSQPTAVTTTIGLPAVFSVSVSESVSAYQWQYKKPDGTSWYNSGVSSAKSSTLTISNTNSGLNGYSYRCVITLASGTKIYSNSAKLTVNNPFTAQPEARTVVPGLPAIFTIDTDVDVASYRWQFSKDGGATWYNSSATGAKTDTLTISNTNTGLNGYSYRCAVKLSNGNWVFSNSAKITVNTSAILSQPAAVTVNAGSAAKFSVSACDYVSAYQWQFSNDGGATWCNSGAAGAKTSTLTISSASAGLNGYSYRCAVKLSNGKWYFSDGAKLTVV